jgi:CDP-4-dehydro-6-deoxyglucose reductase/ferredoxin-NAD(P)+ reductase (naphthalene dioxygenase ferredoxin-specific)
MRAGTGRIDTIDAKRHSVPNRHPARARHARRGARLQEEISCIATGDLADIVPAGADENILAQPGQATKLTMNSRQNPASGGGELAAQPMRVLQCRVDALTDLTHDIRELSLAILSGGPFVFYAGQYVQIEFSPGRSGHYSIASMPAEEQLVFQLRRAPQGHAGSYLVDKIRPGAAVKVSGPLGSSYLRDAHAGPVLLVAGGSGLAPILSILRTLLARGGGTRTMLYFGVRGERDVYHEDVLARLAAGYPNFSYQIVLSQPEGESARRKGLVHQAVAEDLDNVAGYTAYLAGPLPMVKAANQLLLARGMVREDIHADALRMQAAKR